MFVAFLADDIGYALKCFIRLQSVFGENSYRTIKFRNIVSLTSMPGKDYKGKIKKESSENSEPSTLVPRTGIEPAHSCERQILSLLRLPIPPPGQFKYEV